MGKCTANNWIETKKILVNIESNRFQINLYRNQSSVAVEQTGELKENVKSSLEE